MASISMDTKGNSRPISVSPHDIMVLGWRKNKKVAAVAAIVPSEIVLPTKEIDLNSIIAIDDSGFFDVEAEFRDDAANEESPSERRVQFTAMPESIIPPSNFGPRESLEAKEAEREPSESPEESDIAEDRTVPEVLIMNKSEDQKPEDDVEDDDDDEDDDSDYRRYIRRRSREKERRRWIKAEMRRKEKRRLARYERGDFDSDSDDDLSMYSDTSLSWESNCGPDMRCCGMAS